MLAEMLSNAEYPIFYPALAYNYYDLITKDSVNYQKAQQKAISLLFSHDKLLNFRKTDSFPSIIIPEDNLDEEPQAKILGLDEEAETETTQDETEITLEKVQREKGLKAEAPQVEQSNLHLEVFYKHYLQLNAENQRKLQFPVSRFFTSYTLNAMPKAIPRSSDEISEMQREATYLADKCHDTSPASFLALMQIIKRMNQKSLEEQEKMKIEQQAIQKLRVDYDEASKKAGRLGNALESAQAEIKQLREMLAAKTKKDADKALALVSASATQLTIQYKIDQKPSSSKHRKEKPKLGNGAKGKKFS